MTDPIEKPVGDRNPKQGDLLRVDFTKLRHAKELQGKLAQRRIAQERADLLTMLKSPEGQRVALRLLGFCGVYATTADNLAAEGRRQVGLWLITAIGEADPERYPQLLAQHLHHQQRMQAEEAAIAEDHRRAHGVVRRAWRAAEPLVRRAIGAVADAVW